VVVLIKIFKKMKTRKRRRIQYRRPPKADSEEKDESAVAAKSQRHVSKRQRTTKAKENEEEKEKEKEKEKEVEKEVDDDDESTIVDMEHVALERIVLGGAAIDLSKLIVEKHRQDDSLRYGDEGNELLFALGSTARSLVSHCVHETVLSLGEKLDDDAIDLLSECERRINERLCSIRFGAEQIDEDVMIAETRRCALVNEANLARLRDTINRERDQQH
jgi:hypothetical protein